MKLKLSLICSSADPQIQIKTRLGVDKVKPKGWFKFFFDRQVVGIILKLSYFLNFFVGHLLHG